MEDKECRDLMAEINYLKSIQDRIRSILEMPDYLIVTRPEQQELLIDDNYRKLLGQRNALVCVLDCVQALVCPTRHAKQEESNDFSPLVCSSPQKTAEQTNRSNTYPEEAEEAPETESFEAGQRWSSQEEADSFDSSRTGSFNGDACNRSKSTEEQTSDTRNEMGDNCNIQVEETEKPWMPQPLHYLRTDMGGHCFKPSQMDIEIPETQRDSQSPQ